MPLGLFGSQRITPTARPGLVQPQSFLLNTYYDFLTLSDKGVALQANTASWSFKAAAFEPREEIIESVIRLPGSEQANFLQGILSTLLGSNATVTNVGTTVRVREEREFEGGYLGVGHQSETTRTDLGLVRLDLNNSRIEAINLGNSWMLGAWEPSIELIQLTFDESGNKIQGVNLNLTYYAEKWQAFSNIANIDSEGDDSREYVVGSAYYWDANWSGLLSARRLEGDFSTTSNVNFDKVHSLSLSLAYSWQ